MKHKYDFERPKPKPIPKAPVLRRMTLKTYKTPLGSEDGGTVKSVSFADSDDEIG